MQHEEMTSSFVQYMYDVGTFSSHYQFILVYTIVPCPRLFVVERCLLNSHTMMLAVGYGMGFHLAGFPQFLLLSYILNVCTYIPIHNVLAEAEIQCLY